jgi:hypothetical protein
MCKGFLAIVVVAAITMCFLHKKEECRYFGQTASYGEFFLTGRLEGTFYEKSGGDVKAPYTLYIFIETRHDVLSYTVRNLVVYRDSSVPLLQIARPRSRTKKARQVAGFSF